MKIQKNTSLASIIIVNYNNARFLKTCINSVLNQSFQNIEVIVVDNNSSDNSLEILKKYGNKVVVLENKTRSKYGSYNQIESYYIGYLKSNGDYIFFLDSDDFFKRNKISKIIDHLKKNKKINVLFDLPILKYKTGSLKKKFRQKKFILSTWPRFPSQSCITVKKKFIGKLFFYLKIKKFNSIWFDFRIASYCFLIEQNINIFKQHLTYYRQVENSASREFKTLSKNWWFRRSQAHDFITYLSKKLKLKDKFSVDKFLTKIVLKFYDK